MKVLNHDILMDILEEILSGAYYEDDDEYDIIFEDEIISKAFILSGKETLIVLRELTKQINNLHLHNNTFGCEIPTKNGRRLVVPGLWDSFISFGWQYAKKIRVGDFSYISFLSISHLAKNKRLEDIAFGFEDDYDYEQYFVIQEITKNITVPYLNHVSAGFDDLKEISKFGCTVKTLHVHTFDVIKFVQLKNINVLDVLQVFYTSHYFGLTDNITNASDGFRNIGDGFRNIKKLKLRNCPLPEDVDNLESIKLENFGEIFPQLEEMDLHLFTNFKLELDKLTSFIDKFVEILHRFDRKYCVKIDWRIYYKTSNKSEFKNIVAPDSEIFPDFVRYGNDLDKTIILLSNLTISLHISCMKGSKH